MWKLPLLEVRTSVSGKNTDVIAVFQENAKKAILPKGDTSHLVEMLNKDGVFQAKSGTTQWVRYVSGESGHHALFVGLGSGRDLTEDKLRTAGGNTWAKLVSEKVKEAVVQVESFEEAKGGATSSHPLDLVRSLRVFAEGMILGAYQINHRKTSSKEDYFGPSRIVFFSQDKKLTARLTQEMEQVSAVGRSVRITRDWSNEPSNYGTPAYYADEAKKLAKEYGLKCKILTEEDAKREKMGLFLGVGRGAGRESRIVVLEYTPKHSKSFKTVALVGKGVTFDSGGISIKPSLKMEDMKHDMTGAATVMGAMALAAQWKVNNKVIGVMAFVENMPDGDAIQPGNVLTARNGKTVEIINTDAEGRLVLGDALDFVQDFKPDAVVDIATLTGAVSVALGKQCCAVLGNDDALIGALRHAGEVSGEKMWQLPLFDEYFEDLKSDYADMKNSANDPNGGTIRGAIFLKQFIRKGTVWAHLDIASMAYNLTTISYLPKKGASGIYVRTLAQLAGDY